MMEKKECFHFSKGLLYRTKKNLFCRDTPIPPLADLNSVSLKNAYVDKHGNTPVGGCFQMARCHLQCLHNEHACRVIDPEVIGCRGDEKAHGCSSAAAGRDYERHHTPAGNERIPNSLLKSCGIKVCAEIETLCSLMLLKSWLTVEQMGISQIPARKTGSQQPHRCWPQLQMTKDQMAPCDAAGGELSMLAAL